MTKTSNDTKEASPFRSITKTITDGIVTKAPPLISYINQVDALETKLNATEDALATSEKDKTELINEMQLIRKLLSSNISEDETANPVAAASARQQSGDSNDRYDYRWRGSEGPQNRARDQ